MRFLSQLVGVSRFGSIPEKLGAVSEKWVCLSGVVRLCEVGSLSAGLVPFFIGWASFSEVWGLQRCWTSFHKFRPVSASLGLFQQLTVHFRKIGLSFRSLGLSQHVWFNFGLFQRV